MKRLVTPIAMSLLNGFRLTSPVDSLFTTQFSLEGTLFVEIQALSVRQGLDPTGMGWLSPECTGHIIPLLNLRMLLESVFLGLYGTNTSRLVLKDRSMNLGAVSHIRMKANG